MIREMKDFKDKLKRLRELRESKRKALQKVIDIAGGQIALAKMLGVKELTVKRWLGDGYVPVSRTLKMSKISNNQVTRDQLNPGNLSFRVK